MTGTHDPPDSYGFNKLRESGGSNRLTLVKSAVEAADLDPRPPRPVLALIPVGAGTWVRFDVDRYDSQRARVAVRHALPPNSLPTNGSSVSIPSPFAENSGRRFSSSQSSWSTRSTSTPARA